MAAEISPALTNRSIRTIQTELEFLADSNLIDHEALRKIFDLLPSVNSTPQLLATAKVEPVRKWTPAIVAATATATATPKPALPQRAPKTPSAPIATSPEKGIPALPTAPAIPPPPSYDSSQKIVRALYPYNSGNEGDLVMEENHKIIVTNDKHDDWWEGRNNNTGKEGWFPMNRVVVLSEPEKRTFHDEKKKLDDNMMMNVAHNRGDNGGFSGPSSEPANDKGKSKLQEHGKKFGSKLGNAAIFGAGATIGSNIVNGIL